MAGARWAYFKADEVRTRGHTAYYLRAARRLEFHRCSACGILTHWIGHNGASLNIGVNAVIFDPSAIAHIPIVEEP